MTLDRYTIALIIIAVLVAILIVYLFVSMLRSRKERQRPSWEEMYPDERKQVSGGDAQPASTPEHRPQSAKSELRPSPAPRQASTTVKPTADAQKQKEDEKTAQRARIARQNRSSGARQTPVAPRPSAELREQKDAQPPVKPAAAAEAKKTAVIDKDQADRLKLIVADESREKESRMAALDRVVQTGTRDDELQVLLTALNSNQLSLQVRALDQISQRGDNELLDEVIPMLESPNEDVAMSAVMALESIGGPIVEQALLAGLDSQHESVRARIISTFSHLKSGVVEERLIEMAADDDPERARIALQALGECGRHASLEALRSLLSIQTPASEIRPDIEEAARKIQQRVGGSSGTAEYPSFQTEGGGQQTAVDQPTGGDDEFALSLDPDLFKQSGSQD